MGIREVEVAELGHWKELMEVWTKGEVSREAGLTLTGISAGRFEWLL